MKLSEATAKLEEVCAAEGYNCTIDTDHYPFSIIVMPDDKGSKEQLTIEGVLDRMVNNGFLKMIIVDATVFFRIKGDLLIEESILNKFKSKSKAVYFAYLEELQKQKAGVRG